MVATHDTQKLIYLSLRETFVGESALLRKSKKVKNAIEKHKGKPQIQHLIQKGYNIDAIVQLALPLLQEQIFESNIKAKARFPEVFKTSASSTSAPGSSGNKAMAPVPKPSEQKATTPASKPSEQEATASAPKPSEQKAIISGVGPAQNVKPTPTNEVNTDQAHIKNTDTKPQSQTPSQTSNPTIPPGSIYLPFWYQHRIMCQVQTTLEKACFNFALRNLDETVQENAWECAEAIELHKWPKILLENQDKLDQRILGDLEKSLPDILTSIHQIRHTAVHRLRLPAKSALDLIMDAEALAQLLQDDDSIEMISTIRQHLSVAIEDLEETKHSLESRLSEIEEEYAERRIQLAREEAALIEFTKEESKDNDFFANANPDDTLDAILAAQARWKQKRSTSFSIDETYGSEKRHELDLETEAMYDSVMSVEERSEHTGSCVSLAESQHKLGEECGRLVDDANADSHDDVAMPTTCETSGDHPERPKAVAMFDQLDLCLRAYAADGLPKPSISLHSPSTSECEYWATPCGSRSPTEEAPAMDGFKDSVAMSE